MNEPTQYDYLYAAIDAKDAEIKRLREALEKIAGGLSLCSYEVADRNKADHELAARIECARAALAEGKGEAE